MSERITDEAVNAAAEMMWNLHAQEQSWDELMELGRDQMRSEAREVLQVALPHLLCSCPLISEVDDDCPQHGRDA
jgi:hypothetical protein